MMVVFPSCRWEADWIRRLSPGGGGSSLTGGSSLRGNRDADGQSGSLQSVANPENRNLVDSFAVYGVGSNRPSGNATDLNRSNRRDVNPSTTRNSSTILDGMAAVRSAGISLNRSLQHLSWFEPRARTTTFHRFTICMYKRFRGLRCRGDLARRYLRTGRAIRN